MLSSGTRGDQPYVPPSVPASSSLKNPMIPNSSQKQFQKNVYSSLPVADDDDEEEGGNVNVGEESDEEESVQFNSLPLSLSQIMSISKTTVNSAMNIAMQSKNTINDFIANTQSQSQNRSSTTVNRGTYGPSPSPNNDETSSSYDNSML